MRAGGSRELPSAVQLYVPGVNEPKAMGECITLRRFREPLVFIVFGGYQRCVECCEGRGTRAKAAPLQALEGHAPLTRQSFEDDEYEDQVPNRQPETANC